MDQHRRGAPASRSGQRRDGFVAFELKVALILEPDACKTRLIRLPDGLPGQVLKFEFCQEGDCDRAHREHWSTHYLVPPPGEVCRNTDVTEALNWIEQNRKGWLLAGCCVSAKRIPV